MPREIQAAVPEDQVEPEEACPQCGECRADYLVWQEDGESVQCSTCGRVYRPGEMPPNG